MDDFDRDDFESEFLETYEIDEETEYENYFDEEFDTETEQIDIAKLSFLTDENSAEVVNIGFEENETEYLGYDVDQMVQFIKTILDENPNELEKYIDTYDENNIQYKDHPILFNVLMSNMFTIEDCKKVISHLTYAEPLTMFELLIQVEGSGDEDPYYYIDLYFRFWNAFDLFNKPNIQLKIIDHLEKQNINNRNDKPCLVEFIKMTNSLIFGNKEKPDWMIPYEEKPDLDFINIPPVGIDSNKLSIVDQLKSCDVTDGVELEYEFDENLTETDIELIRLFGPVNKCNRETLDDKYGGCRMLVCNCFEVDENDMNRDYFENEVCDLCDIQIADRRYVVRVPLVSGGWLGCFCSLKCANDKVDSMDYPIVEKRIMKNILGYNFSLINKHKIYEEIPEINF